MKRLRAAALVLLSSLLTLVSAEAALRAFYPQIFEHDAMFRRDAVLGWGWIPNKRTTYIGSSRHVIQTNAEGFRDQPFTPKTAGERRVIVLGDSFVSNVAVEEERVFTRLLERSLGETRVFNLGVNGYGPVQEYLLLTQLLERYAPDLVVVVIYLRNDFTDNLGHRWVENLPSPAVRLSDDRRSVELFLPEAGAHAPEDRPLIKRLHLAYLVKHAAYNLFAWLSSTQALLGQPPEYYLCKKATGPAAEELFKVMELMLLKIATYCRERSIPSLFVLAPSRVQAERPLWDRLLAQRGLAARDYDRALPNDRLSAFAKRNGLAMLDLLPLMEAGASAPEGLYGPDQHWNEAGNAFVAREIARALNNISAP
jgi:hypothetical protein